LSYAIAPQSQAHRHSSNVYADKNKRQEYASILSALLFYQIYARLKVVAVLLNNCSNTTVNITACIVLNVFSDVLFYIMVHFVIIISISKTFQVQNKPMGFLPPIQMKGLITMKLIHAEYNPMHNSIDINHYNGYILRIDCDQAESGIRTTPNSQRYLNALAIDNPLEYARLALNARCRHGWMRRMVWMCFNQLSYKGMSLSVIPL